jgi:uncharacterized membrane protein
MFLPQRISAEARSRRDLLFDVVAAIVLASITLAVAAGLGVVGFFGLPLLLVGLVWLGVERLWRESQTRRRRGSSASRERRRGR